MHNEPDKTRVINSDDIVEKRLEKMADLRLCCLWITGYDVTQQIKELLAERPAYQYFRICLQGYKDPDVIFDLDKLSHLERIVDVTEQLRPDYDYEKLLAEHENSLLGAYIAAMQKKRQDPVAAKALEYGVSALLGHEICR